MTDYLKMLTKTHKGRIFFVLFKVLREKAIVEDVYQDVVIKIIDLLEQGKYNEQGNFVAWVLRVARNEAINFLRKKKELMPLDGVERVEYENMESIILQKESTAKLRHAINQLPEKYKAPLIMRFYDGMSFKEIARMNNIPLNTALSAVRKGVENIRKILNYGTDKTI